MAGEPLRQITIGSSRRRHSRIPLHKACCPFSAKQERAGKRVHGALTEPIAEQEVESPAMPGAKRGKSRAGARFWFRRIFFGLVVLGAIPAVLTFVYAPS